MEVSTSPHGGPAVKADWPVPVSVVVPCFNEVGAIRTTVGELRRALSSIGPYELIVVDDGSDDGSSAILDELADADEEPALRLIRHDSNLGYGAAVKSGIRRARGDLIVITDADGTYPAGRIPDLLAAAREADMVVGERVGEPVRSPLGRRSARALLAGYTSWLVGRRIPDPNSGLRVFRRDAAERCLKVLPDGFSLTTTLTVAFIRSGYAVRFMPVAYRPRVGRSKVRPARHAAALARLALRTGMYFAPLRVLLPVVVLSGLAFAASLAYDVAVRRDLTDATVLLLVGTVGVALLAVLAEIIERRT